MLTSAQGLMVYNLFRMPFVMSTLVRPVLSHHYDPQQGLDLSMSETMTNTTEAVTTLEKFRTAFRPTHERMKKLMYFC